MSTFVSCTEDILEQTESGNAIALSLNVYHCLEALEISHATLLILYKRRRTYQLGL